jgi:4-aminobutyrate aminotransferase-like enzyme
VVLDVIRSEDLIGSAARVGSVLREGLERAGRAHPRVGQVRGSGLYAGVDMVGDPDSRTPDGAAAHAVVNAMRGRGVLISATGAEGNVLKIRPPLTFDLADAERVVEEFTVAIRGLRP